MSRVNNTITYLNILLDIHIIDIHTMVTIQQVVGALCLATVLTSGEAFFFEDELIEHTNSIIHETVDLDAQRYQGVWYEQVRSKHMIFESHCLCTTAEYKLSDDKSYVSVFNKCNKGSADGTLQSTEGRAVIPYSQYPGYLLVSFDKTLVSVPAPYAVVDTDYDNYSIVISRSRFAFIGYDKVWILTRQQSVNETELAGLLEKAEKYGYTEKELSRTYQGSKCGKSSAPLS